jgi:hypothetical protein
MGDSAYGSAEMLGWLVHEHGIEPHVTGKKLTTTGTLVNDNATVLVVGAGQAVEHPASLRKQSKVAPSNAPTIAFDPTRFSPDLFNRISHEPTFCSAEKHRNFPPREVGH